MAQKYEQVAMSRKQIVINNFLGGIAWAVGTTVGLTFVVGLISLILSQLDYIPFVGDFMTEINEYSAKHDNR